MVSFNDVPLADLSNSISNQQENRQMLKQSREGEHDPMVLEDSSSIDDAYVSTVPSPEIERMHANQTSREGSEESTDKNEDGVDATDVSQSEWAKWVESFESGKEDAPPNLKAYMLAKKAREDAKEVFVTALEKCLQAMTQAMTEELLADTVGVVCQERGERFEGYESNIIGTFKSNHCRRQEFMQRMEQADAIWAHQNKKIRASICNVNHDSDDAKEPSNKLDDSVNANTIEGGTASVGVQDPNWDEIGQYKPSGENARDFLLAREKLRDADDVFSQALDEIHSGLKAVAEDIAQVVYDFYTVHEEQSLALEEDIQANLLSNYQRRHALEETLQESAKQTHGIFANLLSRLSSGQ